MGWLRRKNREKREKHPARLLAWAILLGLIFGLIGAGEYPEDRLRVVRNHINKHPASGQVVLVGVDEKALREVGRWPWPRSRYAELIEKLDAAKPKRQVHDIMFSEKTEPNHDLRLERRLKQSDRDRIGFRRNHQTH